MLRETIKVGEKHDCNQNYNATDIYNNTWGMSPPQPGKTIIKKCHNYVGSNIYSELAYQLQVGQCDYRM